MVYAHVSDIEENIELLSASESYTEASPFAWVSTEDEEFRGYAAQLARGPELLHVADKLHTKWDQRKDLPKTPPRAPQFGKGNGGLPPAKVHKTIDQPLTREEERHSSAREQGAKGGKSMGSTSNKAPQNWLTCSHYGTSKTHAKFNDGRGCGQWCQTMIRTAAMRSLEQQGTLAQPTTAARTTTPRRTALWRHIDQVLSKTSLGSGAERGFRLCSGPEIYASVLHTSLPGKSVHPCRLCRRHLRVLALQQLRVDSHAHFACGLSAEMLSLLSTHSQTSLFALTLPRTSCAFRRVLSSSARVRTPLPSLLPLPLRFVPPSRPVVCAASSSPSSATGLRTSWSISVMLVRSPLDWKARWLVRGSTVITSSSSQWSQTLAASFELQRGPLPEGGREGLCSCLLLS